MLVYKLKQHNNASLYAKTAFPNDKLAENMSYILK